MASVQSGRSEAFASAWLACGSRLTRGGVGSAASTVHLPEGAVDVDRAVCSWCQFQNDAQRVSCLACGAPLNSAKVVSESGWRAAPRMRDMAEFRVGIAPAGSPARSFRRPSSRSPTATPCSSSSTPCSGKSGRSPSRACGAAGPGVSPGCRMRSSRRGSRAHRPHPRRSRRGGRPPAAFRPGGRCPGPCVHRRIRERQVRLHQDQGSRERPPRRGGDVHGPVRRAARPPVSCSSTGAATSSSGGWLTGRRSWSSRADFSTRTRPSR